MMRLVAAAALAIMTLQTPVRGCGLDLFGVCGGAEEVARELDQLPEKIREASEQVLNHLFNDLLPPTIDKITAAAQQLEDRAEKDYEKAINATRVQLEQLAEKVTQLAEQYAKDVTKDVEQIVDHVEKDMSELLHSVISDVDKRVNALLSRLEYDGKELFCAAQGYVDILQKEFSSYFHKQDCACVREMLRSNPGLAQDCDCTSCFHIGGFYPHCQCNPWGMQFGPGWYNQGKYTFLKCHLESAIDWERWTVDQVVKQLSIVQEASLSFRCLEDLNPGSTGNREYFTNEYTNVTHDILVWTKSPAAARRPLHMGAGARARLPRARDGACEGKTVQECVTQAMAEVQSARQDLRAERAALSEAMGEIQSKANVSQVSALGQQLKANISAVAGEADALKANISAVAGAMRDKADSSEVATITAKVASAQISTECHDVQPDEPQLDMVCPDGERITSIFSLPVSGARQWRCCKEQILMPGVESTLLI